jgi:hypothetical protein
MPIIKSKKKKKKKGKFWKDKMLNFKDKKIKVK